MTAKEKSIDLIRELMPFADGMDEVRYSSAKQCALICVEEIIQAVSGTNKSIETEYYWHKKDYWELVKTELEKM